MAEEVRPIGPSSYVSGSTTVNFPATKTGADLGTAVVAVCGAPGAGKRLLVTGVIFINNTAAAITMVLQEDTGGTPADLFPDVKVAANATEVLNFPQAMPVTENKDLGVKSSSADTGNGVIIFGYCDYC